MLQPAAATGAVAPGFDPALEEVRMRYARGEIDRDEFARRSSDLGSPTASVPAPPPPPVAEPPAEG
jgi:hypothetical protein